MTGSHESHDVTGEEFVHADRDDRGDGLCVGQCPMCRFDRRDVQLARGLRESALASRSEEVTVEALQVDMGNPSTARGIPFRLDSSRRWFMSHAPHVTRTGSGKGRTPRREVSQHRFERRRVRHVGLVYAGQRRAEIAQERRPLRTHERLKGMVTVGHCDGAHLDHFRVRGAPTGCPAGGLEVQRDQ